MNLIKRAKELNTKAKKLIAKYSLKEISESYFKTVNVVGSVCTDLMLEPDIDFDCIVDDFNKKTIL